MLARHALVVVASCASLLTACTQPDPTGPQDPTSEACQDAREHNDDRASAQPLTPGAPIDGLKACAGDVDFYAVTLTDGDSLSVHAALRPGAAPESVTLSVHEASAGMPIAAGTADGDGVTVTTQPGKAGTYYVRVLGVGDGLNRYAISAAVTPNTLVCGAGTHAQNGACVADGCDDFGLEPNEDIAGGRRVVAGHYTGLTSCDGDVDYFVLRAPPSGGALQVALTNMNGSDLDVYATDGTMNGDIPTLLAAAQTGREEDHLTNVPAAPDADVWVFVVGGGGTTYDIDFTWTALDPERDCLTGCRELVPLDGVMDPSAPEAIAAGYYLEPESQYLYPRRDLAMSIMWSFKQTTLAFPDTHPVYVSDICQADGKVPGTDVGEPRHPSDAHIHGHDADIAYFQTMPDNDYRIICGDGSDTNGNGQPGKYNDGYFCTTTQNVVDWPRQAFFMAMLAENPLYHVTGVDQTLPQQIYAAVDALADAGKIPARAAYKIHNGLAYGDINLWPFHHHHIHTQLWNPDQPRLPLRYDGYF